MGFSSLDELYQKLPLESSQFVDCLNYILTLGDANKSALSDLEMKAMQNNGRPFLQFLLNDYGQNSLKHLDLFLQAVKRLLSLFSLELLNTEYSGIVSMISGKTTSLSLAIEYFLGLYDLPLTKDQLEFIRRWKKEIIDPLLERGVNPDKGMANGRPCLTACMSRLSLKEDYVELQSLYYELLKRTKEINRRGVGLNLHSTPLSVAVFRTYPFEMVVALFDKSADPNLIYFREIGSGIRLPLLCFIIEEKNYDMLRLFLERGADPNKMPECNDYIFDRYLEKDYLLTPYQLAVSRKDETAINIIVQFSALKGIQLNTELHEKEKKRFIGAFNHSLQLTQQDLHLQCQSQLFKSEISLLQNVLTKHGIKVFVKDEKEKKNVSDAVCWLFEEAIKSSARSFWQLAFNCLKEEISKNQEFSIYVSEIPSKTTKNTACAGLFRNDIHIQMGLPIELLLSTIAHEAGHLLHHRKFPFNGLSSIHNSQNISAFKKAIEDDLERIKGIQSHSLINERLLDVATLYEGDAKFWDYFTILFVELPIKLAYKYPKMSEKELIEIMKTHFPNTMAFYQRQFGEQGNLEALNDQFRGLSIAADRVPH